MPSQCEQVKKEYEELKALKQEFDLELGKEAASLRAKQLMAELIQKRDALREKLWPFKELSQRELKEQYESQREILIRTGILERLSSGELGIKGIDDKEYVFPSYQEIAQRMRENKETLRTKTEQGFSQLLIVPFGMNLDVLIEKYKQVILKHHKEGKLLATKEKPSDPDEHLELDESQPVWVWDEYLNADVSGKLVYFPKEFSKKHQGKTKQEILKKQGSFSILLTEDLPNIPRQDQGKKIGSPSTKLGARKQLEAGRTPNQYLETLKKNPSYQNETGMTPEEQIIYAILHLEKTNQVTDDYLGKGSISYQLGAFFPAVGFVPNAYWDRGGRQAYLDRDDSKLSFFDTGSRGAVRV